MNFKRLLLPINRIRCLDRLDDRGHRTRCCYSTIVATTSPDAKDKIPPNVALPVSTTSLFQKDDPFVKEIMKNAVPKEEPNETTTDNDWKGVPVVKTTGVVKTYDKRKVGRIGVFWGKGEALNVYKELDLKGADTPLTVTLAELDAVILALRQAIFEKNLTRVVIETDSEFVAKVCSRYLQFWRGNSFMKVDGTPVKNKLFIEDLDRLLQQIDAKVVFSQLKTRFTNDVIAHLKNESDFQVALEEDKHLHTPEPFISLPPTTSNVIYTAGKVHTTQNRNGNYFTLAGYGIHWPSKVTADDCGRYARYPVTEFRTQLTGILKAVELAKEGGLDEVYIVTDSQLFLKFNKLKWTKKDGSPVANKDLYDKIKVAETGMTVHYSYVPSNFNKQMERAGMLADDGMCFPIEKSRKS
ncbi:unnamed protein product [Bursaphelenchus xylophilus]|uniref:ribonuclease H n=1 Tax=Bursaphelenchus xylophilus TaxID=6326 RepID=A0A1I7SS91_BURXY|nr:unnamed protein product [Bursaphelenchus xylophilus]CAG9097890.1 unnamed protein product [Bursaphelenchus xylophilus]